MKPTVFSGRSRRPRVRRAGLLVAAAVLLAATGGCASKELETDYGRLRPWTRDASVNGTDVFAAMFEAAGHEVDARRVLLTGPMQSVDTIVWFPDDFEAPSAAVCEWFDQWLGDGPRRTLIYVGRDFDAAPAYWRKMAPLAPPDKRQDFLSHQTRAEVSARMRAEADSDEDDLVCEWFKIDMDKPREVREPEGAWSAGIDGAKAEIELGNKLVPSLDVERQLTAGEDILVATASEPHWYDSELILVANGSFLLNAPLVNPQHRKLAHDLVRAVGPGRVVFLETTPGGPAIDPPQADKSMWQMFGAWPLNGVLLHVAVLGLIFCFARWPIFGRPRVPTEGSNSDFGKHVAALGELLRRTKDRDYALAKLAEGDKLAGKIVE